MQVTLTNEGAVVVKPSGPLLAGQLDELEQHLAQLSQQWTKRLVLDLADAPFCDSAGMELLCRFRDEFGQRGLRLKLSGLTDLAHDIFDVTRLSAAFEIFPDTAAAVRSFL